MTAWILVTGGAKGFGRAICLELAKRGHSVAIHYRLSKKEALKTVEECRRLGVEAAAIEGDFETKESTRQFIKKYYEQFPKTKGIVNNVGNYLIEPLALTTEKDWYSLFQTNVHTPFLLISALLDQLKKERGSIVNIGTCGLLALRAKTSAPAYAVTKMALWNLTRSLAKEMAPDGVRVNMVSPGYLETAIDLNDPQELPMKRAANLQEAATLVAYFFDPTSSYVTGQNIEIAGGIGL